MRGGMGFRKWGVLGLQGAFLSEPPFRRIPSPMAFFILVIFLIAIACLFWMEKNRRRGDYRVSRMKTEELESTERYSWASGRV